MAKRRRGWRKLTDGKALGRLAYVASGAALLRFAHRHPIPIDDDAAALDAARAELETELDAIRRPATETGAPVAKPAQVEKSEKAKKKGKKRNLPAVLRMALLAVKRWSNDQAARRGAALSYYALFAIGPVLIVAIAIAGAVFGAEAARGQIVGQIQNLIGRQGAEAIQSVLAASGKNAAAATIGGILTLIVAATGAFLELQSALNAIWKVQTRPKAKVKALAMLWDLVWKRLKSLGLVVSLGFLLLVSLVISAALAALGGWLEAVTSVAPGLLDAFNVILSVAFITTLFALIFRILPDVELRWRDVWVGALITAGLFTLGKELIGLYLGHSSTASAYGAAGSLVVLLLWVYYSAQLVLLGAEFTRVYTLSRRRAPRAEPIAEKNA